MRYIIRPKQYGMAEMRSNLSIVFFTWFSSFWKRGVSNASVIASEITDIFDIIRLQAALVTNNRQYTRIILYQYRSLCFLIHPDVSKIESRSFTVTIVTLTHTAPNFGKLCTVSYILSWRMATSRRTPFFEIYSFKAEQKTFQFML